MAKYDRLVDLDADYRGEDVWGYQYHDEDSEDFESSSDDDVTNHKSSSSFNDARLLLASNRTTTHTYDPRSSFPSSSSPNAPKTILRTVVHEMPSTYLKLSIFSSIFCCLAFGIPAIIKSMEVKDQWSNGNIAAALSASQKARYWNKLCVMTGLVCYLTIALIIALKVGITNELEEHG